MVFERGSNSEISLTRCARVCFQPPQAMQGRRIICYIKIRLPEIAGYFVLFKITNESKISDNPLRRAAFQG